MEQGGLLARALDKRSENSRDREERGHSEKQDQSTEKAARRAEPAKMARLRRARWGPGAGRSVGRGGSEEGQQDEL